MYQNRSHPRHIEVACSKRTLGSRWAVMLWVPWMEQFHKQDTVHRSIPSSHHPIIPPNERMIITFWATAGVPSWPSSLCSTLPRRASRASHPWCWPDLCRLVSGRWSPDWYETVVIYEIYYYEWQSICPCFAGRIIPDPSWFVSQPFSVTKILIFCW